MTFADSDASYAAIGVRKAFARLMYSRYFQVSGMVALSLPTRSLSIITSFGPTECISNEIASSTVLGSISVMLLNNSITDATKVVYTALDQSYLSL